tara:strand:+ start:25275 stop:25511 length:237 start_codon:yes stop_codon:yes gene_type:complete
MKYTQVHKITQESSLDDKEKNVIYALIDYKMETEMDKVIHQIEKVEDRLDITFKTLIRVIGIAFTLISVFMGIIALKA